MNDALSALDRTRRLLHDSEIRLQQVLDNTSAAVFAKDAHGRYLFVNRAFERLARRDVAEIIGRTDEEVFLPEVAARFRHNDLCVLREQRAIEFEELCDFGHGPQVFLASKFPLFDAEGVAYAVCGVATDITERKRLEEALSSAALAVSQSEGEALFRELTRYLATIVGADAAFISTVGGADATQMRVRAMYMDGRLVENFNYAITGTPCETVVGQQFRYYPARLTELFPADKAFRDAGFACYAGQPLYDSAGRPVGLIAVVARKPLDNPAFLESVLRIFAVRVGAEFARVAARDALLASETSYREIFEASEDAIFVHDWDTGAVVDVNSQACSTYGYTREELLRARVADLSSGEPPYTEAQGVAWIEAAKRDGSARFEWHRRNKDGSLHWDEVRLKAARIGGTPRVLAFTREITERKQAEEALRASEEQYRAIFNASADAMVLWDSQFRRVDVNPAFERMYGWTRDEVIGRGFDFPSFSSEHARLRRELVGRALAGESCRAEHDVVARDGKHFRAEVHAIPFRRDGEPHVLVIARDITARKQAEEALRASEEQYRTIFNASADALVLWNSRCERVDVNPAYERMYGYARGEVLAGMRASELPEEHRHLQDAIVRRTLAGESYTGEIETVRRSGERFPIEVRTVPIHYRGEPHVLAMIRDLTERRRVEAERARLEAQLRQAQKMEAIGQLTGGIAHDFNNLLTSIMGYVALAGERESALADPRLAGYLAQARRSCERARDLIQQMLMFSRGQRGTPRTVALEPLVEEALASLRPALPPQIDLAVDLSSPAPLARLDPLQFEQVLLNLCINARDATEGAGTIAVSVRPLQARGLVCAGCRCPADGEFVELCVADSGHGMTPEVAERIFEPFFSTKAEGKGTGMGLAMVHGIVHECGGHVLVDTVPGRGSRFRVLWPAEAGDATTVPATRGDVAATVRPRSRELAGTVLVVDDETTVGEFMRELLETWGLQASCAASGQSALDLVTAAPHRFDVVITDQSMPRMTGVQLAHALRDVRGDLPVILYTGYGEGLARPELDAAGIRTVLRKPVEPAALESALRTALEVPGFS